LTIPQISARAEDFAQAAVRAGVSKREALWMVETALTIEAIRWARGNKTRAAERMQIHRNNLDYAAKKLHLDAIIQAAKAIEQQQELFPKKAARSESGMRRAA
jgi:DNA-binding NtrC family response regulator